MCTQGPTRGYDAHHICINDRMHPPEPHNGILQNLTMAVGNPSARCYANAPWRAFTWTCALLQETNTQPWGNLQAAVQESLELAEAVDIQQLPGLKPLWEKRNLNIQGDANHFVNTVWNLSQSRAFQYRFAEIQPGGYLTDHIQQPILSPYPDNWPDSTNLQDLFNGWANTGLGQYLKDDKPALVSHIARNTTVDGTPTKHSKILNTYGTFTVPRSLDGFARTSSEFVPAALICHRGPSHNTGHYFAILIYRDLMWIADDGKPPVHLEHLTPQLASQVTQVWAVHIDTFRTTQQVLHSLPPPEEPDFDPPLHPSPEKRPRLEQQHNQLHFANVTNLANRFLIGIGLGKVKSTSWWKHILIHNNTSRPANTSQSGAGPPLEHRPWPMTATLEHMVASSR